jgi:hypothetical protein
VARVRDSTNRPHVRPVPVVVGCLGGWVALAGSYYLVLPLFGVFSTVTWSLAAVSWLWVISMPVVAAFGLIVYGGRRLGAAVGMLAVFAGVGLWIVGPPRLSPEGLFRHHRHELARLAAEYRTTGDDAVLSWRMRFVSVDGRVHRRCGSTDAQTGRKDCALFLLQWQDWRAESGGGLAYYLTRPGPDASIVTAEGDTGEPVREIGQGWWVIG